MKWGVFLRGFFVAATNVLFSHNGVTDASIAVKLIEPSDIAVKDGVVLIDFGKVWFGNIEIAPTWPNQARSLTVRIGESCLKEGGVDRQPPGTVRYFEFSSNPSEEIIPPLPAQDRRGVTSLVHGAMPFRCVEIDGWTGLFPQKSIRAKVLQSSYFQERGFAFFKNGAPENLNSLMHLGSHTMAATSFMGFFVDGDRERLPYEADAYINQLGWYFVTGDIQVPRKTLQELLKKPTWPSEWMSHFALIAWADYQFSGDKKFLKENYQKLKEFTLIEFIDQSGLVNTRRPELAKAFADRTRADFLEDIVDWPPFERDRHEMLPYNSVVNAFVYRGLEVMASIAEAVGEPDDRDFYRGHAEKLRSNIQAAFIDPKTGLFIDGVGSEHSSAHSLFFPLAFGLVPASNKQATIQALRARIEAYGGGFPCSVYAAQYLLQALFENGADEDALALILNTTDRSWMNMLRTYDATITHEAWDKKYKENIDWNHAWGAAFLNVIPTYLIGVEPTSPGWETWRISPSDALSGVVGAVVPTVHGAISLHVDAQRKVVRYYAPAKARLAASSEGWTTQYSWWVFE